MKTSTLIICIILGVAAGGIILAVSAGQQKAPTAEIVKPSQPVVETPGGPRYVLGLKLKQSHFTLDIGKHLKDAMNTAEFSLAVDKRVYDAVKVDDDLVDGFRFGSMIMRGSFGSWHLYVTSKTVEP